ncbi:hypothetical protein AGMMS50293_29990 [Spirochaetia bacterium]|nr:hypothetical protein AGMMS50293_29990 [Spirochaetia bacterium]
MKKMKLYLYVSLTLFMAVSCGSEAKAVSDPPPAVAEAAPPPPVVEANFNPAAISQEKFDSTKIDVQKFIEDLNLVIRSKNYNAWRAALSDEYFAEISSPEFLEKTSNNPAMKTRKIVLKTAQDYFTNVVVPSRANDRVDDIEFVTDTRVKAFTVAPNGRSLRLYELEHSGNTWKIIN